MAIDEQLLTILACPSPEHGALRELTDEAGADWLECTVCRSRFPVRDGIPVLLADDAVPGPRGLGVPAAD